MNKKLKIFFIINEIITIGVIMFIISSLFFSQFITDLFINLELLVTIVIIPIIIELIYMVLNSKNKASKVFKDLILEEEIKNK